MTQCANKTMRNMSIMFLGLISATMYALCSHTLVLWLTESGISSKYIGYIGLGYIIHAMKIFIIPVFEKFNVPFLNRFLDRGASWILFLTLLAGGLISYVGFLNIKDHLVMFAITVGVANACMTIVDVLLRAKIIHLAEDKDDQTKLSAAGMFGFRVGMFVSIQLFLFLSWYVSWPTIYKVTGLFIMASSAVVMLLPGVHEFQHSKSFKELLVLPYKAFVSRHRKYLWSVIGFMVFFRLQDKLLAPMMVKFYYGLTPVSVIPYFNGMTGKGVYAMSKTAGIIMTTFGVLGSVALLKKYSYRSNAIVNVVLHSLTCLPLFILNNQSTHAVSLIFSTIIVEKAIRILSTNVYYLYQPKFCEKEYAAGQTAILSFIESLSGSVLSVASGYIVFCLSWNYLFVLASLVSLPVIYFTYKLPKDL